jgi:hypothetical protein
MGEETGVHSLGRPAGRVSGAQLDRAAASTYFACNAAGLIAQIQWKEASQTNFFYGGALQRYA